MINQSSGLRWKQLNADVIAAVTKQGSILALDLSLRTGWAYGCINETPRSGVWVLPTRRDLGAIYVALENELEDAIALMKPAHVIAEAPIPAFRDRSTEMQLGLGAHTQSVCYRFHLPLKLQNCTEARRAVMGRSHYPAKEIKGIVMNFCRERGRSFSDDNAADALILWQFEVHLRPRPPHPPAARRVQYLFGSIP